MHIYRSSSYLTTTIQLSWYNFTACSFQLQKVSKVLFKAQLLAQPRSLLFYVANLKSLGDTSLLCGYADDTTLLFSKTV